MKKIAFISLLLAASLLNANPIGSNSLNLGEVNSKSQKSLNTIKDYNSLINDLKQAASLGDTNSIFYLGVVYLNEVTLRDGTKIQADKVKAMKFLNKAVSLGSEKALSIVAAYCIKDLDVKSMTHTVKIVQQSPTFNTSDKDYYSMMLASLILDTSSLESNSIEVATKWLYKAEKIRPTYKMQYLLASLYSRIKNEKAANYYLNKSCQAKEMASICKTYKSK